MALLAHSVCLCLCLCPLLPLSLSLSVPRKWNLLRRARKQKSVSTRHERRKEERREEGTRGKLSEWSPIDDDDTRQRESPTHFVCAGAAHRFLHFPSPSSSSLSPLEEVTQRTRNALIPNESRVCMRARSPFATYRLQGETVAELIEAAAARSCPLSEENMEDPAPWPRTRTPRR